MLKSLLLICLATAVITVNGFGTPYQPLLNVPFGHLVLQPKNSPEQFSARFGSLLKKPFLSHEYERPSHSIYRSQMSDRASVCMMLGAVMVTDECIEYVPEQKTFEDANAHCQSKGGTLWVPKQNEGFLFAKTALYFPEAYVNGIPVHANDNDYSAIGWVGVSRDSIVSPYLTVTGEDYSMAPTFNLFPIGDGHDVGCVVAAADNGAVALPLVDCEDHFNFFCEYIPKEELRARHDTNKLNYFKLG